MTSALASPAVVSCTAASASLRGFPMSLNLLDVTSGGRRHALSTWVGCDDGERALGSSGGPDRDFDILPECGEELHQSANRKCAGTVAHQQ